MLIIDSQYDSWGIPNILNVDCLKGTSSGAATLSHCSQSQVNFIEKYR